jgi:hypothetical protein
MNTVAKAGIPEDSTQFRCMTRQVVNAISRIRTPDQYLRLLTSYIGFRKRELPYSPINRTGEPTVRPKREAIHLARALVMDHTTHPMRVALWTGSAIAVLNLVYVLWRAGRAGRNEPVETAIAFAVLAIMLTVIGEYVSALTRRLRDRPAYYVREEHTSSVLLREERKNVVGITS